MPKYWTWVKSPVRKLNFSTNLQTVLIVQMEAWHWWTSFNKTRSYRVTTGTYKGCFLTCCSLIHTFIYCGAQSTFRKISTKERKMKKKVKPRNSSPHLFLLSSPPPPPLFTHPACFEGRKSAPLQQHGEGDLHSCISFVRCIFFPAVVFWFSHLSLSSSWMCRLFWAWWLFPSSLLVSSFMFWWWIWEGEIEADQ